MKGYKVFNKDWTCREFQYEVGKTYEMKEDPVCCKRGFHFCRKLIDCFNYYRFDSENKVAEIEAMGAIDKRDSKFCTNKIKIIRELTWYEVLDLVNTGDENTGNKNTGNKNTGDWNITDFSTGCFNTKEEKIRLFNKRSNWTYRDWRYSSARDLMCDCPYTKTVWINEKYMTDSEKEENPTWKCSGGYLKINEVTDEDRQAWWDNLDDEEQEEIKSLPNFDKEIFKEITGIEVQK